MIYIGTYYVAPENGGTNITLGQNKIVRSVAVEKQRTYMDCMNPSISYDWLVASGFMEGGNDPVHMNSSGGQFFANLMWNDLNFFALRLDRHLEILPAVAGMQLKWSGAPNVTYDLEASTNLWQWSVIHTEPGSNRVATYTNPPATGNQYFRLHLMAK